VEVDIKWIDVVVSDIPEKLHVGVDIELVEADNTQIGVEGDT
jgi:hypothetical protein